MRLGGFSGVMPPVALSAAAASMGEGVGDGEGAGVASALAAVGVDASPGAGLAVGANVAGAVDAGDGVACAGDCALPRAAARQQKPAQINAVRNCVIRRLVSDQVRMLDVIIRKRCKLQRGGVRNREGHGVAAVCGPRWR